jgi:hypothetical protein
VITFFCMSMSSQRSAISSPRRRPAYSAVAHSARSRSGSASISAAASVGEAIRSRRPRTAGSSSPVVGFTVTSGRGRAGRSLAAA